MHLALLHIHVQEGLIDGLPLCTVAEPCLCFIDGVIVLVDLFDLVREITQFAKLTDFIAVDILQRMCNEEIIVLLQLLLEILLFFLKLADCLIRLIHHGLVRIDDGFFLFLLQFFW